MTYYSVAQQYVDIIKMASPWQSTDSSHALLHQIGETDANGWPEADFQTLPVCCAAANGSTADPGSNSLLAGIYQLTFTGQADIRVLSGSVKSYDYNAQTNQSSAQIVFNDPGHGTNYILYFTNTRRTSNYPLDSGITNIKMIRPQYAPNGQKWWDSPTQEFTDPFLASLQGYSTLRFMDWTHTNGNQQMNWSDRTPGFWPNASYSVMDSQGQWISPGQSWESAIALANATHKNMWINIPVMATDDYITQLANLLKSSLDPGLHVYVEYSNEVWNYGFSQYQYNHQQTLEAVQNDPDYAAHCATWAYDHCHVAARLVQIAQDFASIYGQNAIGTTIRPVFADQLVQPVMTAEALRFVTKVYGSPSKYFYAIAGAPYWSGDNSLDNQTAQQELDGAAQTIPTLTQYFRSDTAYALYYGLHHFTYEGGPGMSGSASLDAKIAANLDPQMGNLVTTAAQDFFDHGGDMYMYYNDTSGYGQYGMWGTTNDVFDLQAPKWLALHSIIGTPQTREVGAPVPGSVSGAQPAFPVVDGTARPQFEQTGYCEPTYCYLRGGSEYGYLFDAPQAGTYSLTLTIAGANSPPAQQAAIYVNQQQAGTISTPVIANGQPATSQPLLITLPGGLSLIEVQQTGDVDYGFGLDSVNISQD
ncbi:MAG: hypothetical protein ACRETC_08345 [Gammaproteobacteria bacterium]